MPGYLQVVVRIDACHTEPHSKEVEFDVPQVKRDVGNGKVI